MRAIAQDDYPVECQTRFRTIPVHEFVDRVTISPSNETVQDCCLGVFSADPFVVTAFSFGTKLLLHDRWPPCHRSMIRVMPQRENQSGPLFACGQALPRNWIIFRRSRLDGLPEGNCSNCFIALLSAATFRRSSRLASVSR
jgi:hypothetical protein